MSQQYSQIISLISGCDASELRMINHEVCDRLRDFIHEESRVLVNQFNFNDRVYFHHKGRSYTGTVVKINNTTVKVDVGGVVWKCSPKLLHHVPTATALPDMDPAKAREIHDLCKTF